MKSAIILGLATSAWCAVIREREAEPQLAGGLSGFVPDASGFLDGIVAGPTVTGELGGIAVDPLAIETAFGFKRQLDGGLFGSVPGASGFLTGIVAGPTVSGELGGIAVDPLAIETAFGFKREAAPAPTAAAKLEDRQIGGGLGGIISGLAFGTISGDIISSVPFGCVGGDLPGETLGATICARAPEPTA